MIFLTSPAPSLDLELNVRTSFRMEVGRLHDFQIHAAAKAVNIAWFLKGFAVKHRLFLHTDRCDFLFPIYRKLLAQKGLHATWSPGPRLRCNAELRGNLIGKFNHRGFPWPPIATRSLFPTSGNLPAFWVWTGRMPPGFPLTAWAKGLRKLAESGVKTVVDTGGGALRAALKVPPAWVKVNESEWGEAVGGGFSPRKFLRTARRLQRKGLQLAAVTRGAKGSLVFWDGSAFAITTPPLKRSLIVGAGDAFLSGLLAAFVGKKSKEECLRWAAALAYLTAERGLGYFSRKRFREVQRKIRVWNVA